MHRRQFIGQATAPVATQSKTPAVVFVAATSSVIDASPYFIRSSFTLPQVTIGVARNQRLDDTALTQAIARAIAQTFDEDKVVLGIQQRQIDTCGGTLPGVAMKVDEAPIRARRLLQALLQREQDDPGFVYRPVPMIEDTTPVLAMA